MGAWTGGIVQTISNKTQNSLPFFISAIYLLYLNKKLGNKELLQHDLKPPLHLKQQLSHDQLIALAKDYNHKIFEEIKMMD